MQSSRRALPPPAGKFQAPTFEDFLSGKSDKNAWDNFANGKRNWKGKETSRKGAYYVIKGVDSFINGVVGITEASKAVSKANGLSNDVQKAAGASVAAMEEQFGWTVA